MQQPACGTMVPWSKMNLPIKILFLSMLWALWAAHRETLQITLCLVSLQQPACGTMVSWSKMNHPIKILFLGMFWALWAAHRDPANNFVSWLPRTASLWHNGHLVQVESPFQNFVS